MLDAAMHLGTHTVSLQKSKQSPGKPTGRRLSDLRRAGEFPKGDGVDKVVFTTTSPRSTTAATRPGVGIGDRDCRGRP